jgi:hypothetical protein
MGRHSAKSTSSADQFPAPPTGSSRLTVKQGAERLGVSRSSAYRIKRVDGPFLFFRVGRRIFIDAPSFETYLGHVRHQTQATPVAVTGSLSDVRAQTPEPKSPSNPRKGSWQRELNIAWRGPSVVILVW